jgi:hypothetical protein
MKFSIYRFNPDTDKQPYMQDFELSDDGLDKEMMLLDALLELKAQDETEFPAFLRGRGLRFGWYERKRHQPACMYNAVVQSEITDCH